MVLRYESAERDLQILTSFSVFSPGMFNVEERIKLVLISRYLQHLSMKSILKLDKVS